MPATTTDTTNTTATITDEQRRALRLTFHFEDVLKEADAAFFAMPLPEWAQEATATAPEPWPVCASCGREYAAWDEEGTVPDTSCWWCEKHANG